MIGTSYHPPGDHYRSAVLIPSGDTGYGANLAESGHGDRCHACRRRGLVHGLPVGGQLATLSATGRGAGGLWELAQHIDGHFLPYYGFMHLWLEFGQAEWWMRLPSALATGAATALIADLGRRLSSQPAGLAAAAVYVFLPSVSYHGQNVRSYAFAAAAAVLATWALYRAIEEPGRRGAWWRYAAAVALLGCTQVFALLVLAAHLLAIGVYWGWGRPAQDAGLHGPGVRPGGRLGAVGFAERHAISWITMPGPTCSWRCPRWPGAPPWRGAW